MKSEQWDAYAKGKLPMWRRALRNHWPVGAAFQLPLLMCRKQHGAAFRSRARVQATDFHWRHGEDLVTFYKSSPGTYHGFLQRLRIPDREQIRRTVIVTQIDPAAPSLLGIALATLDDDPGVDSRGPCLCRRQGALVYDHR